MISIQKFFFEIKWSSKIWMWILTISKFIFEIISKEIKLFYIISIQKKYIIQKISFYHFYKMDFHCCYSWSQINSQANNNNEYNNKFFENSNDMLKSQSSNVFCGCLLFDPQEIGPKIERPVTPFAYTSNNNNNNSNLTNSSIF